MEDERWTAVLEYRTRGFSLIPIQPRDKHPLIAWAIRQYRAALTTEISDWFKQWPDANLGIVTGAISRLVVIDIDSAEANEELKARFPNYDFSGVPRSRTGRGWQRFFQHPGIVVPNRVGIIPGVDVRGDGGYVVAPPSIHPNGQTYIWEIPIGEELPKLPSELETLISSPKSRGRDGFGEAFDTVTALAGVPEGQRDETIFRFACSLRRAGVPQELAEELILNSARNCQPPFSEKIALEKVTRVYRNMTSAGGASSTSMRGEKTPIIFRISDVEPEQVSWLWNGRIPRGKLTIIEGDPGEGKSFVSQAIAAAVTRGFGLPGEPEQKEPQNVLMMSAEDGLSDTIRPRLERMGADIGRVVALQGFTDEEGKERSITLADLDVIESAIIEHRPALAIIDPIIAYVAGKDTHKANEVRSLLAPLGGLAQKYRCAVVAIRHLSKSTAKASYRGQGSIDFLAACRSAFLVGPDPENQARKVLCHIKSNLGPKAPSLTFTINDGVFQWGEESPLTAEQILAIPLETEERTKLEQAKEFLLEVLSNGPVACTEIEKQAKTAGIASATLKRAKAILDVKARKLGYAGGWVWELPGRRSPSKDEDTHRNEVSAFEGDEHLRETTDSHDKKNACAISGTYQAKSENGADHAENPLKRTQGAL